MEYAIKTESLDFYYGKKNHILKNINICVPKGSIYGFLGPNGAGKSTTMQLLSGILPDYTGKIEVLGKSLEDQTPEMFNNIGALVESPALYLHLTGAENLRYICTLKNVSFNEIDAVLKTVGLENKGQLRVKKYSLGMKQRLAIGMALLGNPELLFLDEPVNGLDPVGITEIRELLVKLNKEKGITIFISSHLLSEIEKMCTHVGIINHGVLKFEGTMETLKNLKQKHQVTLTTKDSAGAQQLLSINGYDASTLTPDKIQILLKDKEAIPTMVTFLTTQQIPVYELRSEDGLENWFLSLTQ